MQISVSELDQKLNNRNYSTPVISLLEALEGLSAAAAAGLRPLPRPVPVVEVLVARVAVALVPAGRPRPVAVVVVLAGPGLRPRVAPVLVPEAALAVCVPAAFG